MRNRTFRSKKKAVLGFSLVEMIVGLGLTMVLGAFAYRAFSSHATSQMTEASVQHFDKQTLKAIETIKKDLEAIDYNWITMGVLPFHWAFAVAGSETYEYEPCTFLIPDENFKTILPLNQDITTTDQLVGSPISIVPTPDSPNLAAGDSILVVSNNRAFQGVVTSKTVNGSSEITSLTLNEVPSEDLAKMNEHGYTTFIRKEDALSGDKNTEYGEAPTPPGFFAESSFIQKVIPVTYCLGVPGGTPVTAGVESCFNAVSEILNYPNPEDIYLVRMTGGPKTGTPVYLAKATTSLDFDFDMRSAEGDENAILDIDFPSHERGDEASNYEDYTTKDIVAIRVSFESEVAGRNRDYSLKVMLAGSDSEQRFEDGGAEIADAGTVSASILMGAPQVEHYPDGSRYFYATQVGFADTAYDPLVKSAVRKINVDDPTDVSVLNPPLLDGTKLLGHTTITLGEDISTSPGILIGGYREDSTGDRKATLTMMARDDATKKVAGTTNYIRELGYPDGGSTEAGLQDTAYITDIDDHIYIASFTKDSGDAPLKIFRTKWNNTVTDGFDPVETEYSNTTSATDRQMTSIGPGPVIGNTKYLAFCESSSSWGAQDGRVLISEVYSDGSLGSPIHLANTDWDCRGIHADKAGNLLVGGRLSVKTVTSTFIQEVMQGNISPPVLNLDDRKTFPVNGVPVPTGPYMDQYDLGGGMEPIKWLMGSSLIPIDEMNSELALTNIAGFLSGAGENAFNVTSIRNKGRYASLVASTDQNLQNPNASDVSVVYAAGRQDAPAGIFPPGSYPPIGDEMDMEPTPVCPKPLFSAADPEWNWYACFARTWHFHPTPPDPSEEGIFFVMAFE